MIRVILLISLGGLRVKGFHFDKNLNMDKFAFMEEIVGIYFFLFLEYLWCLRVQPCLDFALRRLSRTDGI